MEQKKRSRLRILMLIGLGIFWLLLANIKLDKEQIEHGYNELTMFTPIYADEEALKKVKGGFNFKGGGAQVAGTGINANFDWSRSDLEEFKKIIYDSQIDIHDPPRATTDMTINGYVDFITHDGGKETVSKQGHDCHRAIISPEPVSESELDESPWVLGYFRADLLESTTGWGDAEQEIAVYGTPVPTTFQYNGHGPKWALKVYAAAYTPKVKWWDKLRRRVGLT